MMSPTERLNSMIKHLRSNCTFEFLGTFGDDGPQFTAKQVQIFYLAVVREITGIEHVIALIGVEAKAVPTLSTPWSLNLITVTMTPHKLDDGSIVIRLHKYMGYSVTLLAQAVFSKYCKYDEDPDAIPSDIFQLQIK